MTGPRRPTSERQRQFIVAARVCLGVAWVPERFPADQPFTVRDYLCFMGRARGLSAAQATAKLLSGRPVIEAGVWLKLLLAFDIVFVAACTLAYPFTVED